MLKKLTAKLKEDVVLSVAWILALLSSVFVTPDKEYIGYIDWETLSLLLALMIVMAGFKALGLFQWMGEILLSRMKSSRSISLTLVLACFFSAMAITNDVALITFVPFALETLRMAKLEESIVPVVVLQTVAANLGSMVTPIGNPQNIYLYFQSGYSMVDFLKLTGPYALFGLALLAAFCFAGKKSKASFSSAGGNNFGFSGKLLLYSMMFILCLVSLSKVISVELAAIIVVAITLVTDRRILKNVDYGLLLTFIGFFIFVGNMGRIEWFSNTIESVLAGHELIVTVLISQVISNVPAALLLAGFTHNWPVLIIGSNLGGLGTLIASMANLISYKYVCKSHAHFRHAYTRWFTVVCLIFLAALLIMYWCMQIV
ncbi:MAG: anion permease [Firmicutes bacterium]|nr:anion permease [Bacillota bacterium]